MDEDGAEEFAEECADWCNESSLRRKQTEANSFHVSSNEKLRLEM